MRRQFMVETVLDDVRRRAATTATGGHDAEIETIVEVALTSRHSLLLSGSPPSGKLLIPLEWRDGRVVEGARLEIALAVRDGVLQISITVAKPTT